MTIDANREDLSSATTTTPPSASVFAVVVLYRCTPESSAAVATLTRALTSSAGLDVSVLVYDNSPHPWNGQCPPGWLYRHDPANGGVFAAYSKALELASTRQEWLLLLDQDSRLPADFFLRLAEAITGTARDPAVAAIVPVVRQDSNFLSPRRVRLGRTTPFSTPGIAKYELTALNSGAAARVVNLRALGGFNSDFWLDYQDYWLFHALARQGGRVCVSGAVLEHSLSVRDYSSGMTVDRYNSILAAEMRFANQYRPRLERVLLVARLAVRAFRQSRTLADPSYARATRVALVRQTKILLGARP